MSSPLRIGVIGLGWIGQDHLSDLSGREGIEVVAVCDLDAELARTTADQHYARPFTDLAEFFAGSELDAVWICTPPQHHLEPAAEALRRGIPVYLEKPVARSLEQARELCDAADAAGVVCAVGYQWHALDVLQALTEQLAGQQVAAVIGQSIGATAARPWFLQQSAGGGNLLERGSHHLDLARAVGGEVAAVQVTASQVRLDRGDGSSGSSDSSDSERDIDDVLTILLRFTSGAMATIAIAWTHQDGPSTYSLDVIADRGAYRLTLDPHFRLAGVTGGQQVSAEPVATAFHQSNNRFLAAVAAKDPAAVPCTPRDALQTLAVALAGEQSLASGGWVELA